MTTTWTIAIDWDRNGNFTGAEDDVTGRVITANWFVGARTPYQSVADNSMLGLALGNSDKRYSPENTSSPLSGKAVPFRPVQVQSDDGTTVRTHWKGWIDAIKPTVGKFGERTVQIVASGPPPIVGPVPPPDDFTPPTFDQRLRDFIEQGRVSRGVQPTPQQQRAIPITLQNFSDIPEGPSIYTDPSLLTFRELPDDFEGTNRGSTDRPVIQNPLAEIDAIQQQISDSLDLQDSVLLELGLGAATTTVQFRPNPALDFNHPWGQMVDLLPQNIQIFTIAFIDEFPSPITLPANLQGFVGESGVTVDWESIPERDLARAQELYVQEGIAVEIEAVQLQ